MTDYTAKTKKDKEPPPEKNIEKVVSTEVIVQKKPLGRKFRDLFIEADFKTVVQYVVSDVLIPAARNMIVDAASRGVERLMYGSNPNHRTTYGPGPRYSYNNPINREAYRDPRTAPPRPIGPRSSGRGEPSRNDFVLKDRSEAELVLERLNDIIDVYEVASVSDLHELLGLPTSHIDHKWGWVFIGDAPIVQVRNGFLIDLPPAEPLN